MVKMDLWALSRVLQSHWMSNSMCDCVCVAADSPWASRVTNKEMFMQSVSQSWCLFPSFLPFCFQLFTIFEQERGRGRKIRRNKQSSFWTFLDGVLHFSQKHHAYLKLIKPIPYLLSRLFNVARERKSWEHQSATQRHRLCPQVQCQEPDQVPEEDIHTSLLH